MIILFSKFVSVFIVGCLTEMTEMAVQSVTSSFGNGTTSGEEEEILTNLTRSFGMKILYIFAGCFGIPGNVMTIIVILR